MLFADITLVDEHFECQEHQWVGVLEDKIAYVGD